MQLRNSNERWGLVSVAFHWLLALLIIGTWALGYVMHEFVDDLQLKFDLYQLHKSLGFTIFLIVLARLAWRFTHKAPPLPDNLKSYERLLAHGTHWGFYLILLLMPIAGWISTETSDLDIPTRIFGLIELPDPFGPNEQLHELFEEMHELLAFALLGLLVLHLAAVVKHQFILKDNLLRRMLPFG